MLNKVTLIGNLGQDPDARTSPNGTTVVRISLATTRRWTDRQTQERKEATEWHRVVFFNRQGRLFNNIYERAVRFILKGVYKHRNTKVKTVRTGIQQILLPNKCKC